MKRTVQQDMLLENVKKADKAWREAKHDAEEIGRRAKEDHIKPYAEARDTKIRAAIDGGLPGKQIHELGLGTTARKTLSESLARTSIAAELEATVFESDPLAGLYSIGDTGLLRVTLAGSHLAEVLAAGDWDSSLAGAERLGIDHAEFSVETRQDGSSYLAPVTVAWMPEHGNSNPVVAWATSAEREVEAVAWWKGRFA